MAEIAIKAEIVEAQAKFKKLTLIWTGLTFVLFPILGLLGFLMRLVQGNIFPTFPPEWFYAILTLHGVGMVGLWFIEGMSAVIFIISKYVKPSIGVSWFSLVLTLIGVVLLIISTIVGRFGAGWYFLYPLPYKSAEVWANWSADVYLIGLGVLGIAWTVWVIDVLRAIAQKYPLNQALAWHYLAGKTEPELPPVILIVTVSCIAAVTGFLAAVALLLLFLFDRVSGIPADPLLMKNLVFYFGHVLVNITMYLGVAILYDTLPQYAQRPWKTNKIVAFAWSTVLFLVLFAYFHHLYMDFVQPKAFQVMGQLASYFISVPAAVVTIFSALAMVYKTKVNWTLGSSLIFLGTMGWAVGGVAAVIDSTIAVNFRFHNTLWVPAHFHTYFLMGVVLMILGFIYHFTQINSQIQDNSKLSRLTVWLLLIGGYGFLSMFYAGGAFSVPRRYALYPGEFTTGTTLAQISIVFVSILTIGLLLYLIQTIKRWARSF
jgi:cytochrome c oxidase subunit 1